MVTTISKYRTEDEWFVRVFKRDGWWQVQESVKDRPSCRFEDWNHAMRHARRYVRLMEWIIARSDPTYGLESRRLPYI